MKSSKNSVIVKIKKEELIMPLIPCPACSNQCSNLAHSCPNCGHPLTSNNEAANSIKTYKEKFISYLKNQNIGSRKRMIISVFLVIVVVGITSLVFYKSVKYVNKNPVLERELCEAVFNGDLAKAGKIIESGGNVNTSVYKSANPLTLAILYAAPSSVEESPSPSKRINRLLMVRYLIDKGADVNQGDATRSPLSIARIVDDDKDLEELLIKAGANSDTEKEEGTAKLNPKKANAAVLKLVFLVEAQKATEEEINKEKRKIIEGKK